MAVNPIYNLWPWPLTFSAHFLNASSGCRGLHPYGLWRRQLKPFRIQSVQTHGHTDKKASHRCNWSARTAPQPPGNGLQRVVGVGGGRGAEGSCPPNSGEQNIFFGQTSCNIQAVDILEEARTGTLYFWQYSVFQFKCTWNILLNSKPVLLSF